MYMLDTNICIFIIKNKYKKLLDRLNMLIAAHAILLKMILVTNNSREFARVQGLEISDWTK